MFFQNIVPHHLLTLRSRSKKEQTKKKEKKVQEFYRTRQWRALQRHSNFIFAEVFYCISHPCLKRQVLKCLCGPWVATGTCQLPSELQFSWNTAANFFSLTHVTIRAQHTGFVCALGTSVWSASSPIKTSKALWFVFHPWCMHCYFSELTPLLSHCITPDLPLHSSHGFCLLHC